MALPPGTAAGADDLIQPFQIEAYGVRGRLVRMGSLVDNVLGRHAYPDAVAVLLGELVTLTAMLSAALKFDGVFSVQVKGDGPVRLMVADVTTEGDMRAYAQFDADRLDEAQAEAEAGRAPTETIPRLLGTGIMAFTVDQGPDTDRYQAIVQLAGSTLADCAHAYFRQSEQFDAAVKLAVGKVATRAGEGWRSAGLMVQRLPPKTRQPLSGESLDEEEEDGWRRAVILMGSSTNEELLNPTLHPHRLLYRLFHEDGVRVFEPQSLHDSCRCSQERVERTLRSFPRSEIEEMKIDNMVVVTCEFCGARYEFDDDALNRLYAN